MNKYRSHKCDQLTKNDVGMNVSLAGWVNKKRDHGNLLFIDLRDNYGITQCIIDKDNSSFKEIEKIKLETVISVEGKVLNRSEETINKDIDTGEIENKDLIVATEKKPNKEELKNAMFAWKVCKYVKSNAIVYASKNQTLGIGAGQMSRIDSAEIAAKKAKKAGFDLNGSCMASDAFFPFRDSIDEAAKNGISCIIQPGGSIRDDEIISAANEANMIMIFTGMRHFRH